MSDEEFDLVTAVRVFDYFKRPLHPRLILARRTAAVLESRKALMTTKTVTEIVSSMPRDNAELNRKLREILDPPVEYATSAAIPEKAFFPFDDTAKRILNDSFRRLAVGAAMAAAEPEGDTEEVTVGEEGMVEIPLHTTESLTDEEYGELLGDLSESNDELRGVSCGSFCRKAKNELIDEELAPVVDLAARKSVRSLRSPIRSAAEIEALITQALSEARSAGEDVGEPLADVGEDGHFEDLTALETVEDLYGRLDDGEGRHND